MSSWWAGRRVLVTGGNGFLGRRVVALLRQRAPAAVLTFGSGEYDLTRQIDVARVLAESRPDVVIHLAARVGGIGANQANPGRFFYDNAIMGIELLEQARRHAVDKYVQVGTVCSYPRETPVPFQEGSLWQGFPEETNAPYGIAKRAMVVQAQAYREQYGFDAISVIPTNLYGPEDNFNPLSSHVIPALIRKCVEAEQGGMSAITVWGSGTPTREFLYVDDAARGILLAAERYAHGAPLNLGAGREISVAELFTMIARMTHFRGQFVFDPSKPDGQPRRRLDVTRARQEIGFQAEIPLEEGLRRTVDWYLGERRRLAKPRS